MPQNIVNHFKKACFSLKGNQLFAGDFHAVLDEIIADMLQFTNGFSNIKDTFAGTFLLQTSNVKYLSVSCDYALMKVLKR